MAATKQGFVPLESLERISDRESLFSFLSEELKWPVDPGDTFTYEIELTGQASAKTGVSRLVPFTADDPFAIMLVEFHGPMRRSDLREILREIKRRVRGEHAFEGKTPDEFVFICATEGYKGIRFAHFKEQEKRQPKLSVFGWDVDSVDETRTLREFNLPALTMPPLNLLGEPDWKDARERWLSAWNVERVTDAFYREYRTVFETAETLINGIDAESDKRLFTQKLFNRLLFVRFLEKKGWLAFNGRKDYLHALWEDYRTGRLEEANFYTTRLKPLFFAGLNNESERNIMGIKLTGAMQGIIGDVPYLNGGLFDEEEDKEQNSKYLNIHVPDDALKPLLADLFYAYNFTVTESTPDDVEVAVDPEMLGKVFEELVTGRHESGSYYTPKPIVSFMCREGLKGYLKSALPQESQSAIEDFVDKHESDGLRNPEAVLDALRNVKVCDPACGSGAYLLGMLHELMDLRLCLFKTKHLDPSSAYDKKLQVIQNNVYGVDLDQFAVNIARLRLWLSLMIEYERKGGEPLTPLPNLDFKIPRGDSIGGYPPTPVTEQGFYHELARQFKQKKGDFLRAHNVEKKKLHDEIMELRKQIVEWSHREAAEASFDWEVDFLEVFEPEEPVSSIGGGFNFGYELAESKKHGGFDIVLANPPYIQQQLIQDQKPALKKVYGDLYCGTADLYVYFYIRALQLLKPGGMLVFISSNKWFKANYGVNLRKYIAEVCSVLSIVDFGELPVFKAATFPMIFVARRNGGKERTCFTQVKTLDPPYPDVLALTKDTGQVLPDNAIAGAQWILTDAVTADRLRKMESAGIPLGEYVNGQIYRGVLTGFNTAFVIDGAKREELTAADPKSAEIIKPLIVGDDVRKWRVNHRDRWLILTPIGINIQRYPAVFAHLSRWQPELEKRWDKGNHWWELRACDYYDAFKKSKIVFPEIAMEQRFAYDGGSMYPLKTVFSMPTDDLYLLGILNSSHAWEYLKSICSVLGDPEKRGRLTLQAIYVSKLPIPDAPEADREAISSLAQKCLDAKGIGCEEWEREIDERVAALYGL